jgi:peptidoglycan/xylan/chitin deacetylase (PgdA/CDA1 family)
MQPGATGPFPYRASIARPKFQWPKGKRLAFWAIPNIETFPLNERMPDGHPVVPNVFSWSRREYGNRVGVFRIMKVLSRYNIRATVALNSDVCDAAPAVIEEGLRLDWEFMGHGETNTRRMSDAKTVEQEREVIASTLDRIAKATGTRPKGWLGPGLQETWNTLDLLSEAGIEYVGDWTTDDQPYVLTSKPKNLISIPYGHDMGDKTAVDHLSYPPAAFTQMMIDTFNVLYRESHESGLVMPLSLHPYITGVPHRIDALDRGLEYICRHDDVWFATGSEIVDWYRKHGAQSQPA